MKLRKGKRLTGATVDDIDKGIIDILTGNGRATNQELASKLSITPATVSARLSRMEEQRIMKDPDLRKRVNIVRSTIPSVTHVDMSTRVQTVDAERNPRFHELLKAFERKTGYGILINTSFNVRGEPIVCTPEDAYRCFMRTEMDYLVLGSCLLDKKQQPKLADQQDWRKDFGLD